MILILSFVSLWTLLSLQPTSKEELLYTQIQFNNGVAQLKASQSKAQARVSMDTCNHNRTWAGTPLTADAVVKVQNMVQLLSPVVWNSCFGTFTAPQCARRNCTMPYCD